MTFALKGLNWASFEVLTTTSVKRADIWDAEHFNLVDIGRRFGGAYCLHHQSDECRHPDN
jgi:hypothetical protein